MRWLLAVGLVLSLLTSPLARSTHNEPDLHLEQQRWLGDMLLGYVVEGCVPSPSATLALSLPVCRAYGLQTQPPKRLQYIWEETARSLTLPAVAQSVWLAVHVSVVDSVAGWTRVPGTHWLWQAAATMPALPDGAAWVARVTTSTTAVTAVEPLASASPLALAPLEHTVYATQYGLRCDGVSDNSAALEAALAALPASGGTLVLPAAVSDCPFSRPLDIQVAVHLRGAGFLPSVGLAGVRPTVQKSRTTLRYTGSGTAITVSTAFAQGSVLEDFDLNHSGTADYGIVIDNNASVTTLRSVSMVNPTVPFAIAAVKARETGSMHTLLIDRVHLKEAAPINLHLNGVVSYTRVVNSYIRGGTTAGIQIGAPAITRHVEIYATDVTNNTGGDGIKILAGEFVQIGSGNHFEHGTGGYPVHVPETATQASGLRVLGNFFSCVPGCVAPVRSALGVAEVVMAHNVVENASDGSMLYLLDNAAGSFFSVELNRLGGPLVPVLHRALRAYPAHNYAPSPLQGALDGFMPWRLCRTHLGTGTVGTGEDTLDTCDIPAETLYVDGMGLRWTSWGRGGTTANTKTIRVRLGTTLIWSSSTTASNQAWGVQCLGLRTNATAMRVTCQGYSDETASGTRNDVTGVYTSGWFDSDQQLTITGEGTADDDVRTGGFFVEVLP